MDYLFLLIYIVFLYVRPQEPGGMLYGWGLPWMNLIAMAIVISWLPGVLGGRKRFVEAPQNKLVIGFLISIALSWLTKFYFHGALQGLTGMVTHIVLYFFIANLIDSEKKLNKFLWLLVLLTAYMAVQGIIQYVTGVGIGGVTMIEGRIRYIGVFNDPNDMALALVIAIPFIFAFLIEGVSLPSRMISVISLCLITIAIYLTKSRGGLLSLSAVIYFYIYKKFSKFQRVIIGLLILLLIYLVAPSRMTDIDVREASAHGRIEGMAHAFWLMRASVNNFIFGAGYGSIAGEYGFVAHNTIMQVAGEIGLIGLFFYISLIYYSLKNLNTVFKDANSTFFIKTSSFSLMASFVGFLVATLFLSRAYSELVYMLIGCSVAITNIAKQNNPTLKTSSSFKELRLIFLMEISIIILAYFAVRTFF